MPAAVEAPPGSRSGARPRFGCMEIELGYRTPFDAAGLIGFLERRAVPGVEQVEGGLYRRSLRLPGGPATIELRADGGCARARLRPERERDRVAGEAAARVLFDLDADPAPIVAALGADPLIGPLVRANPGRRIAGHVDPGELAIRAVIGQQVSLGAARTIAGRLVAGHGEPLGEPVGSVTHLFPSAHRLAALEPEDLPMPRSRARALTGLAASLAAGELVLDPTAEPATGRERLLALPGIGPWTAGYVELRALGNRDAFLPADLGVRHALERLGEDGSPAAAAATAERWRPYRAYALQHLWSTLE